MQITELQDLLSLHPQLDVIAQELSRHGEQHICCTGLYASLQSSMLAALQNKCHNPMLVMHDTADEAQYLYADLSVLCSSATVLFFPTSHRRRQGTDDAMAIQRTEVLATLSNPQAQANTIVVTYPEAMAEATPLPDQLQQRTIPLAQGDTYPISQLVQELTNMDFQKVDFVYEPGQFSVRGGIVDIYSFAHDDPYRIDYFGDEIDSIRLFDIESQLSRDKCTHIEIVASTTTEAASQGSLTDYLPTDTLWVSNDFSLSRFKLDSALSNACGTPTPWDGHNTLEISQKGSIPTASVIPFNTLPQPSFAKNFDLLLDDLKKHRDEGYRIYILADQVKQTDRLQAVFEAKDEEELFVPVDHTLHAGFIDHEAKVCCYTDHEIFERYHRVCLSGENARRGKAIMTLKEINQLQIGDYVVHVDHGIGQFAGLITTNFTGRPQETIKLVYRGGDVIFVSIHNLHRISKYKGKEGTTPTVSSLGSGAWERLKERTKNRVKDIARDLIRLYATRKQQKGIPYAPDDYMQHELEASFFYEDTPDQAKATLDIKHDMESPMPMDRLVCGDVGFGKTEVAMRAAFKAATNGKQVAVLVPTTVLALQHYNTFTERYKNFPVRVEFLSRHKSTGQTKQILQDLAGGKIDILIGTHKIVGKQVQWKDLGLLIIDEEQKFGVSVKEKIKSLRTNIDVLTLTATPIPRTLQFSLLGARDLSVMTTPPQNRYPVQTEVITPDDEDIIAEAIRLEMQRNGQVYVVCNRIEMLPRIQNRVHRMCPQARCVIAHGQMPGDEMEQALEDFINYDYDVLISTTIIESGVDIPNVNTMIIYSAEHYGLADLHQLRGRVGRSNRKAYCYLVAPSKELLTPEARRRLDAIGTFTELGSGFNLAMQDLDIRGAGNMLGSEQSGFIADLGYDTYQRILTEAVAELKEEMLDELSNEEEEEGNSSSHDSTTPQPIFVAPQVWNQDAQLESDIPLSFPQTYIENISERIMLYRELDNIKSEDALLAYQHRLIDRFGPLPDEALELMNVVRLRWQCCRMGIEKIILKQGHMTLFFIRTNDRYWHSEMFEKIISYALSRPARCRFNEERDRKGQPTGNRSVTIQQVTTIQGAIRLLNGICTQDDKS